VHHGGVKFVFQILEEDFCQMLDIEQPIGVPLFCIKILCFV
jgi:hypothetical protein